MHPVVLEQRDLERTNDGTVTLSFDLPRFGISLVTLERRREPVSSLAPKSGTLCSHRSLPPGNAPVFALGALALALLCRRR
jgi:uncharacterized protein (TIGR03382 family)